MTAWVDEFELEGKSEKRFSLAYYYQVDWAKVRLTDAFTYSFKGIEEGITFVDRDGNLTMRVGGLIDHKANRCLSGIVILETAEVKNVGLYNLNQASVQTFEQKSPKPLMFQ